MPSSLFFAFDAAMMLLPLFRRHALMMPPDATFRHFRRLLLRSPRPPLSSMLTPPFFREHVTCRHVFRCFRFFIDGAVADAADDVL